MTYPRVSDEDILNDLIDNHKGVRIKSLKVVKGDSRNTLQTISFEFVGNDAKMTLYAHEGELYYEFD